jgi:hypothetical protein
MNQAADKNWIKYTTFVHMWIENAPTQSTYERGTSLAKHRTDGGFNHRLIHYIRKVVSQWVDNAIVSEFNRCFFSA